MIKIVEATKTYSLKNERTVFALNGVSTVLSDIGMISILGKSGSGKTTFLNMLGGLDSLTSGYIEYNGKRLDQYTSVEFDEFRNEHIAYVFQDYNLINEYNVIENIKIALRFQSDNENQIHNRALEVLRQVGLAGYENRKIKELSGGQQQRVAIARAIAKQARVLLCDEPTGNLDSETTCEIVMLLKEISKSRLVIMVTHDKELAYEFSDKILHIVDGKLDKQVNMNSIEDNTSKVSSNFNDKGMEKRCSLSLFNILKYALKNIRKGMVVSFIVTGLLAISFTFLISFYSLSNFQQNKAIYNTLTSNGAYTVPITRYIDKVYLSEDEKTYVYGPSIECESVSEDDYDKIVQKLGEDVIVYKSYFFNKYFSDFTKNNETFEITDFKTHCFSEFVAVTDFEDFKMPLYAGNYPQKVNEVVIYDYMAYNMLLYGNFDDVKEIEDFVGYDLVDKHTGFAMKIVGLLKSNYIDYMYIEEKKGNYEFETSYLASLQAVFGMEEFYSELLEESKWYSISNGFFYEYTGEIVKEPLSMVTTKPIVIVNDMSEYKFIGEFNKYDDFMGIVLSRKQVAEIYNIGIEEVNEKFIEEIFGVLTMEINSTLLTKSVEKTCSNRSLVGVIGVYDGDDYGNIYCFQKKDLEAKWFTQNGDFKQFYISLQEDDRRNIELISSLEVKKMSEEFYLNNLDYYYEDFMLYTPYLHIIDEANSYLKSVQKLGERLSKLSVILLITGIVSYGFLSIKKNKYKIGIFKSLGARNRDITVIFGAECIVIIVASILLSIFGAIGMVDMINQDFVQDLKYPVVFFKVVVSDYLYPIMVGAGFAIISMLIPLVRLFKTQPITIIKSGRR